MTCFFIATFDAVSFRVPKKAALYAVEKKLNDYVDMLHSRYRTDETVGPEIIEILNAYKRTV